MEDPRPKLEEHPPLPSSENPVSNPAEAPEENDIKQENPAESADEKRLKPIESGRVWRTK